MSQIFYLKSTDSDTGVENIVVFVQGEKPFAADDSHPNFERIKTLAQASDTDPDELLELFDVGETVAKRFQQLSERVSVANGHIYLDGDPVDNTLTKQVVRFLDEGVDDWEPLVYFFENVLANPQEHSRKQLYEWLDRHDFAIDYAGNIIAYKGVSNDLKSIHSGPGIITRPGQEPVNENGRLDNSVGNVIEMPRSEVQHDPSMGCHRGLHVGTHAFASGFGSTVLKVVVNPRDVVSVPTDCNAQKVRVCRYIVDSVVTRQVEGAYDTAVAPNDWDDEEYCDECGDEFDDCECY